MDFLIAIVVLVFLGMAILSDQGVFFSSTSMVRRLIVTNLCEEVLPLLYHLFVSCWVCAIGLSCRTSWFEETVWVGMKWRSDFVVWRFWGISLFFSYLFDSSLIFSSNRCMLLMNIEQNRLKYDIFFGWHFVLRSIGKPENDFSPLSKRVTSASWRRSLLACI